MRTFSKKATKASPPAAGFFYKMMMMKSHFYKRKFGKMSDCGLGAADTGSVVVFASAARSGCLHVGVLLFEAM